MEKQHKGQLTCEEACEKFLPSLDGELAPEVEKAFMVHLNACQDCLRHWRGYPGNWFGNHYLYAPHQVNVTPFHSTA